MSCSGSIVRTSEGHQAGAGCVLYSEIVVYDARVHACTMYIHMYVCMKRNHRLNMY